jgi:hypothetical protein
LLGDLWDGFERLFFVKDVFGFGFLFSSRFEFVPLSDSQELDHFARGTLSNQELTGSYLLHGPRLGYTFRPRSIVVVVLLVAGHGAQFLETPFLQLLGLHRFLGPGEGGVNHGQGQIHEEEGANEDHQHEVDPYDLRVCLLVVGLDVAPPL